MDTFKIEVDKTEYTVRPIDNEDQIIYEVYDDDLVTAIGLNEEATWESNNDIDQNFVKKLGAAIESMQE